MQTSELVEMLHKQADEIAKAGLPGWGNTMEEAAETLQRYVTAMDSNETKSGFSDVPLDIPVMQAKPTPPDDQPLRNCGASLVATREHILMAMKDLCKNAEDTVWLTKHETVFERLASIYEYAGGDTGTLAQLWPEYYA